MAVWTSEQIRQQLAPAGPSAGSLGQLAELVRRLSLRQGTTTPVVSPRRLVLFASNRISASCDVVAQIQAILAGNTICAALAKSTCTELAVIDLGSQAVPLPDAPNSRLRKVISDASARAPLTVEQFRAAFAVGQQEAERAEREGVRLIAAGELDCIAPDLVELLAAIEQAAAGQTDHIPALAELDLGAAIAASAGLFARAAELGLTIVLDGATTVAAALVATHLYPKTAAAIVATPWGTAQGHDASLEKLGDPVRLHGWNAELRQGIGALLAFPLLDAAAAIAPAVLPGQAAGTAPAASVAAQPRPARRVAVFTGSFDPPTIYHRRVASLVHSLGFHEVIVRPTGRRSIQTDGEHAAPIHRAVMVDLAFRDLPGVSVDLADLDEGGALDDYLFDDLYADRGEVWHVVSAEFINDGRHGESTIQTRWLNGEKLWRTSQFIVLHSSDSPPDPADLPPVCQLAPIDGHVPTADIRLRVFLGGDPDMDVPEGVAEYIRRYRLFGDFPAPRETRIRLDQPRLLIVADETNPSTRAMKDKFKRFESPDANAILVLGGDGTMLATIRQHWRRRLPFIGLNAGHLGFLMNESLPDDVAGMELVVYRMPMLRIDLVAPDSRTSRALAYADAWLERNTGQAAWLRVDVDGRIQVPKVVGDGLLVATAAGSSAYARAMGATPVPLTAQVLTLAGSNVFRPRFWKPVALPETAVVRLTSLDETGKRPVRGFLDGHPVGSVSSMEVRVSSIAAVELAFTPQFDLSDRLLCSLFPPADVR
jgi:NAD kinase/NaMN:DMB phosphoribosyltransferase